jgi:hypothetical protein
MWPRDPAWSASEPENSIESSIHKLNRRSPSAPIQSLRSNLLQGLRSVPQIDCLPICPRRRPAASDGPENAFVKEREMLRRADRGHCEERIT